MKHLLGFYLTYLICIGGLERHHQLVKFFIAKVNIALLNKHINYVTSPKFRIFLKDVFKLSKETASLLIP